jgi:hypothetical protein
MVPPSTVQPCVCLKKISTAQVVRGRLRNMHVCSYFFFLASSVSCPPHPPSPITPIASLFTSPFGSLPNVLSIYVSIRLSPQYFRCVPSLPLPNRSLIFFSRVLCLVSSSSIIPNVSRYSHRLSLYISLRFSPQCTLYLRVHSALPPLFQVCPFASSPQ